MFCVGVVSEGGFFLVCRKGGRGRGEVGGLESLGERERE